MLKSHGTIGHIRATYDLLIQLYVLKSFNIWQNFKKINND